MAEKPFATVDDLEARWRPLADAERKRASVLLSDASAMMASAMLASGVDYEGAGEPLRGALTAVCCNIVRRVMATGEGMLGVTQYSQGAVGYTESMSYANPSGDMYMTAAEKRMLGIRGGRVGCIRPAIRTGAGDEIAGW